MNMKPVSVFGAVADAASQRRTPGRTLWYRCGVPIIAGLIFLASPRGSWAQALDDTCIATIANRSVQVGPDGSYAIPNIPPDTGFYRVRVICKNPDGTTSHG